MEGLARRARSATVKPGGDEPTLASVTALTLRTSYAPRAVREGVEGAGLGHDCARGQAERQGDRPPHVVAAGIRSRQYDLAYEKDGEGLVDRITFVLRGKDEYYVLCRWPADEGEPEACGLLQATFATR